MALVQAEGTPGRWSAGDGAGLYVFVAGVSAYPHLAGGSAPAKQTYGLSQLFTSATAAWRVFTWLRDEYTGALPVAKVWLALAPTAAERAQVPEMADQYGPATYDELSLALDEWRGALADLPADAAARSRALFFFSGHGLEIRQGQQLLLPSDWLRGQSPNPARALASHRLRDSLASLALAEQLFFLDACRNDCVELRALDLQPADVLPVSGAARSNPNQLSPMFYATATGARAFQQTDLSKGTSIFVDALITGLRGGPGIAVEEGPEGFAVTVYPLQKFLKRRMADLLARAGATATQNLMLTGNVDDIEVTRVKAIPPAPGVAESFAGDTFTEVFEPDAPFDPREAPAEVLREAAGAAWLVDVLQSTRSWARQEGRWTPGASFSIEKVVREEGTCRLTVTIPAGVEALWLGFGDVACVLGGDGRAVPRYAVDLVLDGERIEQVRAGLASGNAGPLRDAARRQGAFEAGSVPDLERSLPDDLHALAGLVDGETAAPLAAVVAGIVLSRVRRRRLDAAGPGWFQGWLSALTRAFPTLPDAAALCAAEAIRTGETEAAREAARGVSAAGLPWTTEGLNQLADALDALGPGGDPVLAALDARVRVALRHVSATSLFLGLAGPPDSLTPVLLGEAVLAGA